MRCASKRPRSSGSIPRIRACSPRQSAMHSWLESLIGTKRENACHLVSGYQIFSLGAGERPELAAKIELRDKNGSKLVADGAVGRAETIHLVSNGHLYQVDLHTALARWREG